METGTADTADVRYRTCKTCLRSFATPRRGPGEGRYPDYCCEEHRKEAAARGQRDHRLQGRPGGAGGPAALEKAKLANRTRNGSGRRRHVDPTTCEPEYGEEQLAFMNAMDRYKRENRRPFPTWSEVLEVLRSLGYRKVAEPTALPGASHVA